jgi:outer membrane protein
MRILMILMSVMMFNVQAFAETKIVVVDMEKAFFLSNSAIASIKQFEKDNKEDIKKIKKLEKELKSIRDKMAKNSDVMSDKALAKKTKEFEEKATEFKFYARKLQQQEQQWKQDFFKQEQPTLEKILKKIIEKGKYDIVLQAGAVIFHSKKTDITKELIDQLNKRT